MPRPFLVDGTDQSRALERPFPTGVPGEVEVIHQGRVTGRIDILNQHADYPGLVFHAGRATVLHPGERHSDSTLATGGTSCVAWHRITACNRRERARADSQLGEK